MGVTLCLVAGAAVGEAPRRAVVFDFELIDTSLEGEIYGPRPDEARRLALIGEELRQALAGDGRYVVLDHGPARAEIAQLGHLYGCNGCEAAVARSLGAELAITGTVQKVSSLIPNINLYLRDAASGRRVDAMSVDLRGNTDESWSRGVARLLRDRLLKD